MKNAWGDELAAPEAANPWGDAPATPAPMAAMPALEPTAPAAPVDHMARAKQALAVPLGWLAKFGERVDRYTGAPVRAGIGAMQGGRNPVSAYADQFGEPSDQAPTGKDIAARAGLSTEVQPTSRYQPPPGAYPNMGFVGDGVSPAGFAGFAIDMLADPTNVIPLGAAAKMGGKAGMGIAKVAGETTAKVAGTAGKVAAAAADVALPGKVGTKAKNAATSSLKAAEQGFNDLGKALKARYGAKLAPDAQKHIQTALNNSIDPDLLPESILHGETSSASRLARAKAETPMGQALREKHKVADEAIQEAIRADIRRIGGEAKDEAGKVIKEAEIPPNAFDAGELVKNAYDKKVGETMGHMDVTYRSIIESGAGQAKIPQEAMAKLNAHLDDLEREATEIGITSLDNTTEAQAKHLLEVIGKLRARGNNLGEITRGLQGLGRTVFKTKTPLGQTPPDIAKLRKLYHEMAETVNAGVRSTFGQEAAEKLASNNKTITELFGDKALIPSLGDAGKSADRLFRSLILEGDAKRINTLKKYLSSEELQQVKGATLELLNKETIQGEIRFRNNLARRLSDKNDAITALFDAGELDNLKDLFILGDKLGPAVLSTSGTGGSLAHQSAAWSDWLRPTKLADKAEATADKIATAGQKTKATRAIGFEVEERGRRAAARTGQPPPAMGFSGTLSGLTAPIPNPRTAASRLYYLTNRDEDERKGSKK